MFLVDIRIFFSAVVTSHTGMQTKRIFYVTLLGRKLEDFPQDKKVEEILILSFNHCVTLLHSPTACSDVFCVVSY